MYYDINSYIIHVYRRSLGYNITNANHPQNNENNTDQHAIYKCMGCSIGEGNEGSYDLQCIHYTEVKWNV